MSVTSEVKEFYSNDIVYRFDKRKRISFGMVLDSYEASDDADEFKALEKGQIRVWWLNNSREQVWRQNKVRLMSRSVIPGDVVRRLVNGKETQRGYCKESKQFATAQIVGTDKIIERVSTTRLKLCNLYDAGAAVCLGKKYGRIQSTDQLLTMQTKCGSVVSVLANINHDIEDYFLMKSYDLFEFYYPGQEVICTPSNLEQPNWIHRSRTLRKRMQSRHRFIIQSVEPANAEVHWFEYSDVGFATRVENLDQEDIRKLKVLDTAQNFYLDLGERRLLRLNASDCLIKKRDWIRKQSVLHRPGSQKVKHVINVTNKKQRFRDSSLLSKCMRSPDEDDDSWSSAEGDEETDNCCNCDVSPSNTKFHFSPKMKMVNGNLLPVLILCMDSKATIVWQDGTEEKDIPTTQLYYSTSLDDHEFFPGEWVIDDGEIINDRYGAVQHVNYLERTATVKWFTYSEEEQKPQVILVNEISVYDLRKHPKYAFRPGSIVKSVPTEEDKMGTVIDSCPEGYVSVQWIDGLKENCWPQKIELIPDTLEFSSSSSEDEEDAQGSWETESIESFAGDVTDETSLQNIAARLDYVRNRIVYLKDNFLQHAIPENFLFLRDLLIIYDNSSYLDKLLDTSFFSLKSKHFQALLVQAKERMKKLGVELRGRLFSSGSLGPSATKLKVAEKENINKIIKLEHKVNVQIECYKEGSKNECGEPSTPITPDTSQVAPGSFDDLCIELLSMLKVRMDLAYAEIISRIGGNQAFSVMTKALEKTVNQSAPSPPPPCVPVTPEDSFSETSPPLKLSETVITDAESQEAYNILDQVHPSHHYFGSNFEPQDRYGFFKAVHKEHKLLRESLPPGVWVRSYSDRLDLMSVMIRGPNKTPYEDGLFLFDLQLSSNYPRSPPLCHYISYSSERLNPNLYADGKVCVSLLGTWMGRGTEVWGPNSTLLQLMVSIQGLILVSEPYYNEAGYDKQSDSQQGCENSRTYNEFVILKLVQSLTQMLKSPPHVFKSEIFAHFAANGEKMCERLAKFCDEDEPLEPDFLLLPVSKGLKLSLASSIASFREVLKQVLDENKSGQV